MEENEFHQRQPLLSSSTETVEMEETSILHSPRFRNGSAVKIDVDMAGPDWDHETKFPKERWKTVVSLMFVVLNFLLTTVSLSVTHELRNTNIPPLPDLALDNIPYKPWALDASEVLIMFAALVAAVVVFSHKHRYILIRRVSLNVGILYGYRAVTMLVTSLPSANRAYFCDAQLNHTISVGEVAHRVVKIWSGFGLSINGQHVYCGDWIFSGHTMVLILCYLIVEEYSDSRYRLVWLVQWLLALVAWVGVAMLMLARGHYSVDVVIAYFVTTRVWYIHNTIIQSRLAGGVQLESHLSRLWWWRFVCWLEENVRGQVPHQFEFPLLDRSSAFRSLNSKPFTRDI